MCHWHCSITSTPWLNCAECGWWKLDIFYPTRLRCGSSTSCRSFTNQRSVMIIYTVQLGGVAVMTLIVTMTDLSSNDQTFHDSWVSIKILSTVKKKSKMNMYVLLESLLLRVHGVVMQCIIADWIPGWCGHRPGWNSRYWGRPPKKKVCLCKFVFHSCV